MIYVVHANDSIGKAACPLPRLVEEKCTRHDSLRPILTHLLFTLPAKMSEPLPIDPDAMLARLAV
ncbi:hypothetical protein, partial [uncultured Phenylobacterium sp.]|uniref:hypothetical protein n=1 Tax=uncultured Phenylobacterium sp. TaxID=349273 RepID=UPI0025CD6C7A